MDIGIFGLGAMGCLLAAGLATSTSPVMIGEWPEQINRVRNSGLSVEHTDGSVTLHHPSAMLREETTAPLDVALLVEKSHQTEATLPHITRLLRSDGVAITLQNGLGHVEQLRAALGLERATLGVTSEGATLVEPGRVRHAGNGYTNFGVDRRLGAPQHALLREVCEAFNAAGFAAGLVEDPESLVWSKLAINAAINPLTALLRVPNGFLLEYPSLGKLMDEAAREVVAVAAVQGIELDGDPAERARSVARATATNRSSMLQDIERSAPTEIDAICGAVTRLGLRLGVPTPLNRRLMELVRAAEQRGPLIAAADVRGLLALIGLPALE